MKKQVVLFRKSIGGEVENCGEDTSRFKVLLPLYHAGTIGPKTRQFLATKTIGSKVTNSKDNKEYWFEFA